MIKKADNLIKGGIVNGQEDLINRWCRKVTLRNALIHNARKVNKELVEEWPKKFTDIGVDIVLEDGDVVRAHFVAFELAREIDKQFQRTVIKDEDARTIAQVIYLMDRTKKHGEISKAVYQILNYPFTKNKVESAVANQEKTRAYIPGFNYMQEVVADTSMHENEEEADIIFKS